MIFSRLKSTHRMGAGIFVCPMEQTSVSLFPTTENMNTVLLETPVQVAISFACGLPKMCLTVDPVEIYSWRSVNSAKEIGETFLTSGHYHRIISTMDSVALNVIKFMALELLLVPLVEQTSIQLLPQSPNEWEYVFTWDTSMQSMGFANPMSCFVFREGVSKYIKHSREESTQKYCLATAFNKARNLLTHYVT